MLVIFLALKTMALPRNGYLLSGRHLTMVLVLVEAAAAILLLLSQIQLLSGMLTLRGQVDARHHPCFLVGHSKLLNVGEWKMIHPFRNLALIDDTVCVIELFLDTDRVILILT